jgi:signal transduction histidine kinase
MAYAQGRGPEKGRRGRLVRRYFLLFATLLGGSLLISGLVEMGFRFQETQKNLQLVHSQMAELAALRVEGYIEDIAKAVRSAGQPREVTGRRAPDAKEARLGDKYIFDFSTLQKSVPAIRDVLIVGLDGREQLRWSRIGQSVPDSQTDHTEAPYFTAARAGETYFGPVMFPQDSFEPRIIIAVPVEPFKGSVEGILAAEVNVRYVLDVIQEIQVGESGYAYVVSGTGTLVAHPDLQLVLQNKNLSDLPQVAALSHPDNPGSADIYKNLNGQRVLEAHKSIPNVGWTVFVERPLMEAYAPLLASLARTGGILFFVCLLAVSAAVMLGRRVVRPIEVLRYGAARLEAGNLDARLSLKTGDEFEELAEDFNRMAGRLQDAYSGLEQKVSERTKALEQSLNQVQGLVDTIGAVSASLDLEKVLQTIVVHATELSRSDAGLIYEFDESARVFRFQTAHLVRPEFIETLKQAPPTFHDSLIGRAAITGAPEQIIDVAAVTSYRLKDHIVAEGYRSLLAVPAIQQDRLVGGIVVARREPGGFTEQEIELLHTFANGSTIAIENARLFRELEQKNTALLQASQHKSQFLANMSHELRTPLNALIGYTELMLDGIYGAPSDRMCEVLKRLESNGRHLLGLINDVLDLSKMEAGQLNLSVDSYSMKDLVNSVADALQSLAQAKRLAFTTDVPPDLPVGSGDERRIAQVLLNLIGNAIKFTDSGEVAVSASAANGSFTVAIRDTGPGVSVADQAKIFDEFQQVDSSSTRKKGGTGLGLPISKKIVEMHGGRIWINSSPGNGSTFFFTLPVNPAHQAEAHE